MDSYVQFVIAYLVCINILGFLFFGWDKHRAVQGYRRIAESDLLFTAFIGGAAGSLAAQHLFRHKTRKQPFKAYLYSIAALQLVLLITLSFQQGRNFMSQLLIFVLRSVW